VTDPSVRIEELEREVEDLRRALAARTSAPFGEGLPEREALLSEAERIVHLGCWMWDTTTNTIRWSDELFRIFGLDPGQAPTTETFFGGIHPGDVARVQSVAGRGIETGNPEPVDFRVVRPDGAIRDVHMEAAIVREGAGLRFVGTVLDVTERHAMEARLNQAQKLEALGTLAGGVAHDFNNYLHVILGHLDLLVGKVEQRPDIEDGLVQIRAAATQAQHLTRQLLLLGRRRASRPEVVSLDSMLDASTAMLGTLLGDRVRLRRVRAPAPLRVRIDRGALEQVVLNLAANARDAMPEGGRITIDLDTLDVTNDLTLPSGRYAVLAVEDDGAGIPPDVLPHIFEPFYTTKEIGNGTGLGLSTAHGIVTEAGGAIRVTTAPGRGTTFRVLLPLADVPDAVVDARRRPTSSRGSVLVVEDQPEVRRLVRIMLEEASYDVSEAEDGADALRVLGARPDVRIVLSDLSMPKVSGRELAQRLARDRPDVRVVLMGGVVDSSAIGVGVAVLRKPFGREELLRTIEEAFRDET
jgi:PAS domain S-box-containing protein